MAQPLGKNKPDKNEHATWFNTQAQGTSLQILQQDSFSDIIVIHCKMPIFQNKQFSEEGFDETFSRNFHIFVFSIQNYIHSRIANYPLLGTFLLNTLTGGQLVISASIFPRSAFHLAHSHSLIFHL